MKNLIFILLTLFSIVAFGQGSNPVYSTMTLQNGNTAADSVAPVGQKTKMRYDPVTGKIRFWNSVTAQWYSFNKGASLSYGTTQQIPYMNTAGTGFNYSSKFKWDNTNNNLIAAGNGAVFSGTPTNSTHFGSNTTVKASWVLTNAEESTVETNAINSISSGWHHTIGHATNICSGCQSATFGLDHTNQAVAGMVSGIGGRLNYVASPSTNPAGGFVHGMMTLSGSGLKPAGIPYVTAIQGAVNISRNTSAQVDGNGAMCLDCGIYSGLNNHLPSTSPRSFIGGGSGIVGRASDPDQAYFPNLNIVTTPLNDDALTQVLARDGTTGQIKYRSVTSIGSLTGLTSGRVPFANSSTSLIDDAGLNYSSTNSGTLSIGTSAPFFINGLGQFNRNSGMNFSSSTGPINVTVSNNNIVLNSLNGELRLLAAVGGVKMDVGGDATADTYYRDGSGFFKNRSIGTSGQVYTVSGGLPVWQTPNYVAGLTAGRVSFAASATSLSDDADLTFSGSTLTTTNQTITSLTSGRVPIVTTGGSIIDDSDFTFSGTTLTTTNHNISSLTDGRVPFIGSSGSIIDEAGFTYNSAFNVLNIPGLGYFQVASGVKYGGTIECNTGGDLIVDVIGAGSDLEVQIGRDANINAVGDIKLDADGDVKLISDGAIDFSAANLTGLITSGTYTPTLTNVANISATTSRQCQYLRVGNSVTVSGVIDIDPTNVTSNTSLGISLPIVSDFSSISNCGGNSTGQKNAINGEYTATIQADTTNDRASLLYSTDGTDVLNTSFSIHFTYLIQ